MNHLPNIDVQGFFLVVSFQDGINILQKVAMFIVFFWTQLEPAGKQKNVGPLIPYDPQIIPKSYEMFG